MADENIIDYKLDSKWVLWFHDIHNHNHTKISYKKIYEFDNLEDFLKMMNNIPHVVSGMFYIMRDGIFPLFEDPKNINGGFWTYKVSKRNANKTWLHLACALIGNTLTRNPSNMRFINGIQISPKINNCIFKIWCSDYEVSDPDLITDKIDHIVAEDSMFRKHKKNIEQDKIDKKTYGI